MNAYFDLRSARSVFALYLAIAAAGCSERNPAQPSASAGTGSLSAVTDLTASVTAPRPLTPPSGAQIKNLDQPVTLVVQNAPVTKASGTTYTFEVATDAAFVTKVQVKDGVAEGTAGQTSIRLDTLAADRDYFWHARATSGGTTGVFGAVYKLTIGPAISINAPAPAGPLTGAATNARPSLVVNNSSKVGPAGPIVYRFEVAQNAFFVPVLLTANVAETSVRTSFTPSTDLPAGRTLFWRATAVDLVNGISSAPSATQSFTTTFAIDLNTVVVSYPDAPTDVASWRQTATIDVVEQDGSGEGLMCIAFSLSNPWPSVPFFGSPEVPVYANQWYFANIGGQWYGGPGEYLRSDRGSVCKTGQGTGSIGPDGGWSGPMRTWVPKAGELVGYMISTPARNYSTHHSINERSNIVVQPWHDSGIQGFSAGRARN